jgi:hypothetical protein
VKTAKNLNDLWIGVWDFLKLAALSSCWYFHTGAAVVRHTMDLRGTEEILPATLTNPEIHNFLLSIHCSYYTQKQYQSQWRWSQLKRQSPSDLHGRTIQWTIRIL